MSDDLKIVGDRYELTLPEIDLPARTNGAPDTVALSAQARVDLSAQARVDLLATLERAMQTPPPGPAFGPGRDVLSELMDAERALAERAREAEPMLFQMYLAPRRAAGWSGNYARLVDPDPPRRDPPGAPVVTIDCERRTATIDGREVRWTAHERGDGATILVVRGWGVVVVAPGCIHGVEPRFEFGSTLRRKARQILYPLARAWCQIPQRAPRGRKAGR